jgi:FlaG/FlaF family flagellin (archaellin)
VKSLTPAKENAMIGRLAVVVGLAALLAAGGAGAADRATADAQTKQLLLLMDKDQNGKVSREEFMNFMAAEFERLDVNKDGELDVNELTGLRVRPGRHTGGSGSK